MAQDVTTVRCPKCGAAIPLTEAIAGPAIAELRDTLAKEHIAAMASVEQREAQLNDQIERAKVVALANARAEVAGKIADDRRALEEQLAQSRNDVSRINSKLSEAQAAQAAALKLQRELEDRSRALDLEVEQRITNAKQSIEQSAQRVAEERFRLTIAERERTISKMSEDLANAQRLAEQRDQKAQGEILEIDFENRLRQNFPEDNFSSVSDKSGRGDIHQIVSYHGRASGTIVWELKRTKNWSEDWAPKLRGIQRAMNASAAIVCSQAMPGDCTSFGEYDKVWICSPEYALPLCTILRQWIIEVDLAGRRQEGQASKAELVYQYMTGTQFRQRIEAIVEHFSTMRDDLSKERQTISKSWAKREAQLNLILNSVSGLYGDLQGIAGATVKELPALTLSE